MSIITEVIESTKAIIQGMSVTLSYLPKRKQTVQYPEEPVTVQPRYRGQHLLHVDELGREKCVACFLCAAACPSECIYIEAADDPRPAAERIGVDERYAKIYNIDYGRCIFCGYCVEAFPTEERFALTSQIRRSSRSVCLNLREAWAKRRYEAHFVSKLTDCDGENSETDSSIDFANDCGYITADEHQVLTGKCAEIGRMLGQMYSHAGY